MKTSREILEQMAREDRIGPKAQEGKQAEKVREALRRFNNLEEATAAYLDDLTGSS